MTQRLLYALVAILLLSLAWRWLWIRPAGGEHAPEVDVRREPLQKELEKPRVIRVERDGRVFQVQLTHEYEVSGLVLSRESYDLTWTNDFFDVDLGLIWGEDVEELRQKYKFHQDGRWLYWRSQGPVSELERARITQHIGNQHLIPREGSRRIAHAIRWVGKGDRVRIRGFLATILDSAWQPVARSSTRRDDTGAGACEIVWVEEIQIGGRVYRLRAMS